MRATIVRMKQLEYALPLSKQHKDCCKILQDRLFLLYFTRDSFHQWRKAPSFFTHFRQMF